MLVNVKRIREITVDDDFTFEYNYNFIQDKKPVSLVYLESKEIMKKINEIQSIQSLKYLMVPFTQLKEIRSLFAISNIKVLSHNQ